MLEYFLKPQLSPSVSGLMGFILGEQLDQILNSEKVENSGNIASTLILALYCFEKSKSFDSCIRMAVQDVLGDRKLVSAVAGSFAGVYYKLHSRPIQDVTRCQ